ncbi:hypothetical protein Mevan_0986 [Methanococcus vannielii SB]|uniref:Glycosyltransferase RgtA/B/C/D-like domain-containing protein n=1 Tax=Methanococcus vannielii (strain ATCC 35089 / DSM 1224 / JCM 13029 / OCM 148 / SB) TaxID=406327 RepID=A6UQW7_METVS|nr:DUF6541 family protein [Methanococcus vannielii]ABR54889.1 hypothetical protein Mevan_0986 [Methanococcus vannielii SB]
MDIFYFLTILVLLYLVNPLKNEERLLTTPFLAVSYIVILSYLMSVFDINLIKIYYLLPLIFFNILNFKKISVKNLKINKISGLFVILISIFAIFTGFMIFPENPLNKTDTQFHSYKLKAIFEEKNIFYETKEIPYLNYINYPSGYHSFTYLFLTQVSDIPSAFNFLMYFMLILMVTGFYLIGEAIKKGLGYFTAPFVISGSVFYGIIYVLYPNYLAYSLFLISVFFLIRYLNSKETTYLFLFSFVLMATAYTHTIPFLMIFLFIVSILIHETIFKNYTSIKNYLIYFFGSSLISFILISKKLSKEIISYSKSSNIISEPLNVIIHNIFAGFGIFYLFTKHPVYTVALDNELTFLISIFLTYLFLIGIYSLLKNKLYYLAIFPVLLLAILINSHFIHFNIPFFNTMYASNRMMYNIQAIMPIFYGFGAYSIFNMLKKNFSKVLFILISLCIIFSSAYANSQIIPEYLKEQYVVSGDDLMAFDWINKNEIFNETFLNFGQDAGQFLPIYTSNQPAFYYTKFSSGNFSIGDTTLYEIAKFIDEKDHDNYSKTCKENNIRYVYVSEILGKYCTDFFKNEDYFKIRYQKNNVYIVEVI